MRTNNILRKNKGFLLLSAYVATVFLMIVGLAMFSRIVHAHKFTAVVMDELAARYAAERGIDYVITEIKYKGGFHTHVADKDAPYLLRKETSNPLKTSDLKLSNVVIDTTYGSYCSVFPNEDAQFVVKVYSCPINSNERIIISKGLCHNQTKLIITKYCPSSLYQFFIFTPLDWWTGNAVYDAGGGKIHANGDIIFSSYATISDIAELSTPKSFKEPWYGFVPPGNATDLNGNPVIKDPVAGTYYTWEDVYYTWRHPWTTTPSPGPNLPDAVPNLKYYNVVDGKNFASYGVLLMKRANGTIGWWDGVSAFLDPYDYNNRDYYMCGGFAVGCSNSGLNEYHAKVNSIKIPGQLNTPYNMNKFKEAEKPVYYKGYWFSYPPENIVVHHLDSEMQPSDWKNFITNTTSWDGKTLSGILREKNTGGEHYEPLSIAGAAYKEKAITDGLLINKTEAGDLEVKFKNGEPLPWSGNRIDINGVTGVFEKKSFVDVNSTNTKEVIALDMDKLKTALGANANLNQNIIYSNYPMVIENATQILDDGLTTVCEENIYLRGNYNTALPTPAPSAAISAKFTYTLSDNWDYPQTLPTTNHNINYPYEHDFYCPQGDTTCMAKITDGRPLEEKTSTEYPEGRNWYLDNYQSMANQATSATFNVALVGYNASGPGNLERWSYYTNPGSLTEPPSSGGSVKRTISGARVRLEESDFPATGVIDWVKARCCTGLTPETYNPCRDCEQYTTLTTWDMIITPPGSSYDVFIYNTEFANGNVPPGDLVGYSSKVFLEFEDSDQRWNYHSYEISMPK